MVPTVVFAGFSAATEALRDHIIDCNTTSPLPLTKEAICRRGTQLMSPRDHVERIPVLRHIGNEAMVPWMEGRDKPRTTVHQRSCRQKIRCLIRPSIIDYSLNEMLVVHSCRPTSELLVNIRLHGRVIPMTNLRNNNNNNNNPNDKFACVAVSPGWITGHSYVHTWPTSFAEFL
jgi:hypothetical protein